MMLEPKDIGARVGLSGLAVNRLLAAHGYQAQTRAGWCPTEQAAGLCGKHQWISGGKTGYNYKWRALFAERSPQ